MEKVKYRILSNIQHVKILKSQVNVINTAVVNKWSGGDNELYPSSLSEVILLETVLGTCLVLEKQSLFFIMIYGDNFVQKLSKHGTWEASCHHVGLEYWNPLWSFLRNWESVYVVSYKHWQKVQSHQPYSSQWLEWAFDVIHLFLHELLLRWQVMESWPACKQEN